MPKILVVDDDFTQQRILGYTLKKSGYTVVGVYNGHDALRLLAEDSFDLVISDIAMPEMDGLTLLRELRNQAQFNHLPVIMLTASGQDQDRLLAQDEGANGFLTKPTSSRELLDTVHRILN